ncbi:response regulator [Devosia sp. LjRoot3]|uniref:response regulator n=1 Tax=Devosia sp. LjRoot3 TaxID=3342319 RepID=UPI003ECC878E
MLLEDEPLIAMEVEFGLREAGFDVDIVATCAEAIEWLEVCCPDAVIVDIVLRDGPCHAVVERLAADHIAFIVHSADLPAMHAGTPFEHGIWVNKPTASPDLIEAVIRATSKG